MEWEDRIDQFEVRTYKDKYLETCEVLDDEIEVNIYSCPDISNYEIYVNYGVMYGIVYVHKNEAESLKEEIKKVFYDDYKKNGYSKDMPTKEFINWFAEKYKLCIPDDIFFDETQLMEDLLNMFEL